MGFSLKDDLLDTRTQWYGHLTLKNVERVYERLSKMLAGKYYTWVALNDGLGPRPEVRTSQRLSPESSTSGQAIYLHYGDKNDWAMIGVNDTYGCWSISTDSRKNKMPYLLFEHNKLTIEHYAPGGNWLIWVIAVEERWD